ncbi:MAG: class I SAM-dependent methyltransferase [Clostridiales bacterium]|nr:class I SAM-dependent methyltransferase [Clostridiales bacterium]
MTPNPFAADPRRVRAQYAHRENLSARIALHRRYSTNPLSLEDWLARQYEFSTAGTVLDLGAGTGESWRNWRRLLPDGARAILTDQSAGMVCALEEIAREFEGFSAQQADVQSLPFEDNSAQVILANFMLYHVADLPRALEEIRRVLAPSGLFYAATCGAGHMRQLTGWMRAFNPEWPVEDAAALSFHGDHGERLLSRHFKTVRRLSYRDSLCIPGVEPLMQYIASMEGMNGYDAEYSQALRRFLAGKLDNGCLTIQKESTLFIASGTL